MIDNYHVRNYVKAMSRNLKSLAPLLVLATLLSMAAAVPGAWAGAVVDANRSNPGQTLEVKSLAVRGKTTLIDFYSPYCPPCVRMAPVIAQLAAKRPDLAVKKVNINRPEASGIDWRSPLAEQYQIRSVPYFMIFSPQGKLVAEGHDAFMTLKRWLQEAGLTL
jgi:thiol-disulfide isomerase/thioredoxin